MHTAEGYCSIIQLGLKKRPTCPFRDKKLIIVVGVLAIVVLSLFLGDTLFHLAVDNIVMSSLEYIGTPLQEQHPEDIILIGCGIQP